MVEDALRFHTLPSLRRKKRREKRDGGHGRRGQGGKTGATRSKMNERKKDRSEGDGRCGIINTIVLEPSNGATGERLILIPPCILYGKRKKYICRHTHGENDFTEISKCLKI